MHKQLQYSIQYDEGKFWLYVSDTDSQEEVDFKAIDALAGGFKWSMAVVGKNQRKRHCRSVMTPSVYGMLDYVKEELRVDSRAVVYVLTPDVELMITA